MPAMTPADVDRLFAEAISSGNLEAALACYEEGASLVPSSGQVAKGAAELREAVAGFTALKATLDITVDEVIEASDLALLRSRWTLRGTDPSGQAVDMAGAGAEVVRRQADGSWRFIIDHPFAAMPPQT